MSQQMVSFKDYEGIQGFGLGSMAEVDELNKALSAGNQRPPASGGSALRVESLEATLRTVTFSLQNIKFWPKIPKLPAFSTVEEYNILSNYGNTGNGVFTDEGALPESQDADYARRVAFVKFLGTTREVTHPMTLVRPAHGNVIGLETQNGAIFLVQALERALFNGRSDIIPQEFDGLEKQVLDGIGVTNPLTVYPVLNNNATVIDLHGASLSESFIQDGANRIVENYGIPTDLHATPRAIAELNKGFYNNERFIAPFREGEVGIGVRRVITSAGTVEMNPNVFLRAGKPNAVKTYPTSATSSKAPNAPASVTPTPAGAPTAGSQFRTGENGNYYYAVTAINQYGESAATLSAVAAVIVGDAVTLVIADGGFGAGAAAATGYRIYRTGPGATGATTALIMVAGVPRTGGSTTFIDYNWYLPGTARAYMVQNDLQNYSFRQLAPMLKIPLATVAASIRWMQLLYGTPIVYSPKRNVIFLNVKDE